MRLVDDQRVVPAQVAVRLDLGQQDAVGHQLDQRVLTGLVAEPHLVAHRRPERGLHLLGHALGHRPRRQPPRLRVPDLAAHTAAQLQADLRQLRGLARPRLARHDHHLVVADQRQDLVLVLGDRQLRRVGDLRDALAAHRQPQLGLVELARDLRGDRVLRPLVLHPPGTIETALQPALVAKHQLGQTFVQVGQRRPGERRVHTATRIERPTDYDHRVTGRAKPLVTTGVAEGR